MSEFANKIAIVTGAATRGSCANGRVASDGSPRANEGGRGDGEFPAVGASVLRHRQLPPDGRRLYCALRQVDTRLSLPVFVSF